MLPYMIYQFCDRHLMASFRCTVSWRLKYLVCLPQCDPHWPILSSSSIMSLVVCETSLLGASTKWPLIPARSCLVVWDCNNITQLNKGRCWVRLKGLCIGLDPISTPQLLSNRSMIFCRLRPFLCSKSHRRQQFLQYWNRDQRLCETLVSIWCVKECLRQRDSK
jgi:hypothetical protein